MAFSMRIDNNNNNKLQQQIDAGKYVRYSPEQVDALEKVYAECPKPTSTKRQQLIRECPILANIEAKQIKVWFQNRRCRDKQRKEASRLHAVNKELNSMNRLLMMENERLQKQVSKMVYMRQQLHTQVSTAAGSSSNSLAISGHQQQQLNPSLQHPQRDATTPAGLLAIAEETLAEFLGKATGTTVDWVQLIGMKPGPDSIGIVSVARDCVGVAARACGLVSLEPTKVAEVLKDRLSWFHECCGLNIASSVPTANGGTIELIYMQTYAQTPLAPGRDYWNLRYTSTLQDGSIVICERSLTSSTGGPTAPLATSFVRADMLPSGYLIRPDDGGSIINIVDHIDLNAGCVPEFIRPLYESSKILAQKMTMAALRHVTQIAQETHGDIQCIAGREPAVLRALSRKLCRGFNEAVNCFVHDGWTTLGSSDGVVGDVTIAINSSPIKFLGSEFNTLNVLPTFDGVLCARASMLVQSVPPALLVRFLREHRSEWADYGIDAYSAASIRASPFAVPCANPTGFPSNNSIQPIAQNLEHDEYLEVVHLEGQAFSPMDMSLSRNIRLLQLCNGMDEGISGNCAQLVFAHIDESFRDDSPLLPSGFRIVPLDPKSDDLAASRTLDLASALGTVHKGACSASHIDTNNENLKSVLTIAFQFKFENRYRDNVAAMAREYVHSIVRSVQRVALAIAPARITSHIIPNPPPCSPEALTLARWVCRSFRVHTGGELAQANLQAEEDIMKQLWVRTDAIMCCSVKMNESALFTFANKAGLDMLETTLVSLQEIKLEKTLDEVGLNHIYAQFSTVIHQGFAYLPAGICVSSMGKPISYEQLIAWKVLNEEGAHHCLAFMFMNWSFV